MRASKNPCWPCQSAATALIDAAQASSIGLIGVRESHWRMAVAGIANAPPGSQMVFQNSCMPPLTAPATFALSVLLS